MKQKAKMYTVERSGADSKKEDVVILSIQSALVQGKDGKISPCVHVIYMNSSGRVDHHVDVIGFPMRMFFPKEEENPKPAEPRRWIPEWVLNWGFGLLIALGFYSVLYFLTGLFLER